PTRSADRIWPRGWHGTLAAMADWVAISSLATAGGTLALAATTYASVRSANRAARAAEGSLLAELRPLFVVLSLRNVGPGIGVLHGGHVSPERVRGRTDHTPIERFRMLSRDIYIP